MNVKPDDLAIVIKSPHGVAIGSIVKVMFLSLWGPTYWVCEFQRPVERLDGSIGNMASCDDAWLRPISGIPDTEDADTEQPIVREIGEVPA